MVSFFGLRFGADKKKKEPEQIENSLYAQQWKASREEVLRQCSGISGPSGMPGAGSIRPSTAQGAHGRGESHTSMGSGTWDPHSTEPKGSGSGSSFVATPTSASAGPSPISKPALKPYASEANLKLGMGASNGSSSSLTAPRLPLGGVGGAAAAGAAGGTGPRPGSAHSTRQEGGKPFLRPLDVNVMRESTPGIAGPSRSPLGRFELMSPVSDNESLLGDEPERVANAITNRVAREEEQAKVRAELEERSRAQAELRAQATRNVEGSGTSTAKENPSSPASIQGERHSPSTVVPGQQKPNLVLRAQAAHDMRPGSSGRDLPNGPSRLSPGPRIQPPTTDGGRSNSRGRGISTSPSRSSPGPQTQQPLTDVGISAIGGRDVPNGPSRLSPGPQTQHLTADVVDADSRGRPPPGIVGPIPSPGRPLGGASVGSDPRSLSRGRSQTADNLTPGSSMLRPQGPREPVRGATVPAVKPSRSLLFQHSSHLDLPRPGMDRRDGHEPRSDNRAENGPYGVPSPPLSNGQHPSGEVGGQPIIRDVQAKRDTAIIDGPDRESLGLQIDEFEKTLQQAQAMTALEKGPDAVMTVGGARSRGNSDGSSNYSDISESPMTIEPPLISPQPFPLTPRPMGPPPSAARPRPNLADILPPTRRPTLELELGGRSESPAGGDRSNTPGNTAPRRPTLEIRAESPAGRPRPRLGIAPPRRPTLEEYGNIRINTVPPATNGNTNRTGRPSLDGHDGRLHQAESPTSTDSPILKNVRNVFSPEQMSEGPSSAETSRENSPVDGHYHSVFSPPPPAKRPQPPRPAKQEWDLGPAPTAPPTTPLPIPERNTRRKNTADSTARGQQQGQQQGQQGQREQSRSPSGLASAVRIVPGISSNPNWPLPGPRSSSSSSSSSLSSSISTSAAAEGGSFSARRSLLPDRRAPPAPLNIAATRYEDCGPDPGPSTPDVDGPEGEDEGEGETEEAPARIASMIRIDMEFDWREERVNVHDMEAAGVAAAEEPQPPETTTTTTMTTTTTTTYETDDDDKSFAIGVARGLSLKYDRMREQERRARARERMGMGKGKGMGALRAAWTIDEAPGRTSPARGEWSPEEEEEEEERQRQRQRQRPVGPTGGPVHGLLSPTGLADAHGTGFI